MSETSTKDEFSVVLDMRELERRLDKFDGVRRDVICLYVTGYDLEYISREHGVSLDFIRFTVEAFLSDCQ